MVFENVTTNTLTNFAMLGPLSVLLPSSTSKSNFENTGSISTTALIIIVVLFILYIFLSLTATYKLTGSGFQTFLCFLFGFLYMSFAYMYYGLAGYKICS